MLLNPNAFNKWIIDGVQLHRILMSLSAPGRWLDCILSIPRLQKDISASLGKPIPGKSSFIWSDGWNYCEALDSNSCLVLVALGGWLGGPGGAADIKVAA